MSYTMDKRIAGQFDTYETGDGGVGVSAVDPETLLGVVDDPDSPVASSTLR